MTVDEARAAYDAASTEFKDIMERRHEILRRLGDVQLRIASGLNRKAPRDAPKEADPGDQEAAAALYAELQALPRPPDLGSRKRDLEDAERSSGERS